MEVKIENLPIGFKFEYNGNTVAVTNGEYPSVVDTKTFKTIKVSGSVNLPIAYVQDLKVGDKIIDQFNMVYIFLKNENGIVSAYDILSNRYCVVDGPFVVLESL